jgi:hypothetical protein
MREYLPQFLFAEVLRNSTQRRKDAKTQREQNNPRNGSVR